MGRRPSPVVLDSWAVISYLEDEASGEKVGEIIADAHEAKVPVMMSVINVAEVWYIIARETSVNDAENSVKELIQLGIEFVDMDWKLSRDAANFKAHCKMSMADCYAAALAKYKRAELLTGDTDFKQVEAEVKVRML
jgi:predicted nucleic acid-binding protein